MRGPGAGRGCSSGGRSIVEATAGVLPAPRRGHTASAVDPTRADTSECLTPGPGPTARGRQGGYAPTVAATDESAETGAETTEAKLDQLRALRDEARHAGSAKAVERQRSQGKLLARERAERLCDPDSFVELDRYVRHRESNFG